MACSRSWWFFFFLMLGSCSLAFGVWTETSDSIPPFPAWTTNPPPPPVDVVPPPPPSHSGVSVWVIFSMILGCFIFIAVLIVAGLVVYYHYHPPTPPRDPVRSATVPAEGLARSLSLPDLELGVVCESSSSTGCPGPLPPLQRCPRLPRSPYLLANDAYKFGHSQ